MGAALSTAFDPDGPIFGIDWSAQIPTFPGWPDVGKMWNQMGGWPGIQSEWTGWPNVLGEWKGMGGWPDLSVPSGFWPDLSLPSNFWPTLDARDVIDELTDGVSGGGGGGGGGNGNGGFLDNIPWLQGGGRVSQTGAAVVHRNEMVADPDRLVSELASAVNAGSGGGATVDMSGLERKLDTLIREVKRSDSGGEASIRIGEREFAKLVGDAQSNTTTSTDRLS